VNQYCYPLIIERVNQSYESPRCRAVVQRQPWYVTKKYDVKMLTDFQIVGCTQRLTHTHTTIIIYVTRKHHSNLLQFSCM